MSQAWGLWAVVGGQVRRAVEWIGPAPVVSRGWVWPCLLLAALYFLSGMLGLQLQSAQTGVTPVWPPSGIALVFFVRFGTRVWPGVLAGMLGLATFTGVPVWVGVAAGVAAVLESAVPLALAKRYGFQGRLSTIRNVLLFIGILSLGPLVSATTGTIAMRALCEVSEIPWPNTFTLWWLGNSIGMLVVGGTVLVISDASWRDRLRDHWPEVLLVSGASLAISLAGFTMAQGVISALIINLLIPLVFLASIRIGAPGALLPGLVSLLTLFTMAAQIPREFLDMESLNILYLDLVDIWFITITGLVVAVAYRDQEAHFRTHWLAHHDALTQLPNRLELESRIGRTLSAMGRTHSADHLLFIDLDDMKRVNDQAGHLAGDRLLQAVARLLATKVPVSDLAARWGGDEFAVLLSGVCRDDAMRIAGEILDGIRQLQFWHDDNVHPVTASIGVTGASPTDTLDEFVARADSAAYAAKRGGRNRVIYQAPPDSPPVRP